ncbi:hypothetical protein GCM10007203_10810 [Staphylococcus nepalensis]|nr:hypothetical protein GCM10007203_10810 [Staphylococcus nepalensis]
MVLVVNAGEVINYFNKLTILLSKYHLILTIYEFLFTLCLRYIYIIASTENAFNSVIRYYLNNN